MVWRLICCFVLLFAEVTTAFSIVANNPNVVNISSYEYRAGNKNWSIAQDSKGFLYVGNNDGLLQYDGLAWKLYTSAPCEIIRSVSVAENDVIYTGGFEEFGKWERDEKGQLQYSSLSTALNSEDIRNVEIWKIHIAKEGVYFQSFSNIFLYKNGEVWVIHPNRFIMFLQQIRGEYFVEASGDILQLKGTELNLVQHTSALNVSVMLPYGKEEVLMGSSKSGLYIWDGKHYREWNTPANRQLRKEVINCGLVLDNGNYLLGTLINGMYEVSPAGEIVNHFNTDNFLQNNTVLSLFKDHDGNIWVGLDNGITRLVYNESFSYYLDPKGSLGSLYTGALFEGRLYLGTNRGLFYIPVASLSKLDAFSDIQAVSGVTDQIWRLEVVDDQLIVGHNKGAVRIKNGEVMPLLTEAGVLSMHKLQRNGKDYLLLSTYSNPLLLRKNVGGLYEFDHLFAGFDNPCPYVEIDFKGYLWMAHSTRDAFMCSMEGGVKDLKQLARVSEKGLDVSDARIRLGKIDGRIVFVVDGKFYTYDDIERKICPYDKLNQLDLLVQKINKIVPLGDDKYGLIGKNTFAVIYCDDEKAEVLEQHNLYQKNISTVDGYEDVSILNDSLSLICLNNGFIIRDSKEIPSSKTRIRTIQMNHVSVRSARGKVDTLPVVSEKDGREISYSSNNIRFEFSYPFVANKNWQFQYKLQGVDEEWSESFRNSFVELERLPSGTYVFMLRVVDDLGNTNEILEYPFRISRPWYRGVWGVLLYLFVLGGVMTFVWYYLLQKRNRAYLAEQKRQEAQRIKENNEQLRQTVKDKNQELFNTTLATIQKNELLEKVRSDLESFQKNHFSARNFQKLYDGIMMELDEKAIAQEDWKLFVMCFENNYEDFFKNVKTRYPNLSSGDLKLCACMKLNLSTKEAASLLGISVRGVEVGRYRLRKKINLDSNENLNEFFIENF
jgi:outer membrane protein assembly factor BamB